MKCPMCSGERVIRGYGCPGFKLMELQCPQCHGIGELTETQKRWITEGEKRLNIREHFNKSLREYAKELKIPASMLSDIEHGRIDPETPLNKLQELARAQAQGATPR